MPQRVRPVGTVVLVICFTAAWRASFAQRIGHYVNAQLPWHQAVVDSQGRLLAWYEPARNMGYDHVVRLAWDFIEHKVPRDTRGGTGLKIYLVNSVFDDQTQQGVNWQHNPAMVFASFVDSLVGWYRYSGDEEAVRAVREMLDYELAHGTTPSNWEWSNVPFATSCDNQPEYGRCIQDMPKEFYGGTETDKVGELGTGYVLFYQLTGEHKYLDAALHCAQALARHVRSGDADHTPWAFRVDARTGATLAHEEYGGNVAGPLRLFEQLIYLNAGDVIAFRKARDTAWQWVLAYPLNPNSPAHNNWSGYFEDVPFNPANVNQLVPMMLAYYILAREDPAKIDPNWMDHVGRLIDWVRRHFGRGPFYGAQAIDEQGAPPDYSGCCSRSGQGDYSARWGAINAMYSEKTQDGQAYEDAFRSLNYATYFADSEGKVSCCGRNFRGQYWFSDGYSDYIRHFMWAMAAIPAFAPKGQNHLLGSTSVVQKVNYGDKRVTYHTFDKDATEVLRLNFQPASITVGGTALSERKDLDAQGYRLEQPEGSDYIVRVRHTIANEVSINAP